MASNLSISVRADTAEARAQLALVQSDVRSLGTALRRAAADARASDIDGAVSDQLRAIAGQFEAAKRDAAELGKSLNGEVKTGFGALNAAIKEPLEGIAQFKSSLRETAELAGAVFAIDEIKEFSVSMAEAGEKALNTAFALQISVADLAKLQGVFTLAGGSADDAQRTFERLGQSVQQALSQPNSQAARTFQDLGISMAEVKAKGNDLMGLLVLLIQRYSELSPSLRNIGALHELLGRQVDTLVPVLRQGASGFEELAEKSKDYQRAMLAATPIEAAEAEKLNELKLQMMILANDGFATLAPIIYSVTDALRDLAKEVDDTIQSTAIDIQQIMKYGDELQNFLSRISHGLIPPAAPRPGEAAEDQDFVGGGRQLGNVGPAKKGSQKGQATELETWREQLQAQLEAEQNYFKDSTAEELAFWEQKVALTKNGSKEQAEVESTIYGLKKRLAQQGLRDDEEAESRQESLDRSYLTAFEANMKLMVAQKQISLKQALGFDIQYTEQIEEQEKKRLQAFINDDRLTLAEKQQYTDRLIALENETNAKVVGFQTEAANNINKSWEDSLKQIGDQFADLATDVVTHTKTIGQAFDQLIGDILKDSLKSAFKSLFDSMLPGGGGAGGGSGSGGSGSGGVGGDGGIGGSLLSSLGPLGGLIGGASSLFSSVGTASEAVDVAGMWGGGGEAAVASGLGGGGFTSFLASILPALPFFEKGGIVPSAAGGWAVPQLGSGGTLAQLHSNEMVLPENVSNAVLGMANGGGGHTFNLGPISAVDAPSVAKLFANNGSALVQALNTAVRNGSTLRTS